MIQDVVVSIGRVGTLAVLNFLQSAPEITPTSWFDVREIIRHWQLLDAAPQRFVPIVHHSSHLLSLLNKTPSENLRISWNTRCPFASARSSINWRVFQNIVVNNGCSTRPWTELVDVDDCGGFYPQVAAALRGRNSLMVDASEYGVGQTIGYEKLARHHHLPFERMAVPDSTQNGLFETFLCSYRFTVKSLRFLIIPAKDLTWEDCDLFLGYVPAKDVFPQHYQDGRLFSVYVAMDRPDSQWKREFAWQAFQEHKAGFAGLAEPVFQECRRVYETCCIAEGDQRLDAMVNQAFGGQMARFVDEFPWFREYWQIDRIAG
jgi:hypothetical protein